jgi:hypothetical protein
MYIGLIPAHLECGPKETVSTAAAKVSVEAKEGHRHAPVLGHHYRVCSCCCHYRIYDQLPPPQVRYTMVGLAVLAELAEHDAKEGEEQVPSHLVPRELSHICEQVG